MPGVVFGIGEYRPWSTRSNLKRHSGLLNLPRRQRSERRGGEVNGSRPGRIDVSRHYDELIVPNEREQRAAAKQKAAADESALETDCVSSESSLSQMTRPTRENTDLGGIEAIEEEKIQDAQSDANDLRDSYETTIEKWNGTKIQELLDAAIKDHGLNPDGSWWVDADADGTSEQLTERLESIAASFENF